MSPNFFESVKEILKKLHLPKADKKDPEPLVKEDPTLPNKNLIFTKDPKTEAEKKTKELTKDVLDISRNPYGEESSDIYPPKDKP